MGIPAQFVYEAADCRLFYEPKMTTNVTAIWKKVADAAWGTVLPSALLEACHTRMRRRQ